MEILAIRPASSLPTSLWNLDFDTMRSQSSSNCFERDFSESKSPLESFSFLRIANKDSSGSHARSAFFRVLSSVESEICQILVDVGKPRSFKRKPSCLESEQRNMASLVEAIGAIEESLEPFADDRVRSPHHEASVEHVPLLIDNPTLLQSLHLPKKQLDFSQQDSVKITAETNHLIVFLGGRGTLIRSFVFAVCSLKRSWASSSSIHLSVVASRLCRRLESMLDFVTFAPRTSDPQERERTMSSLCFHL